MNHFNLMKKGLFVLFVLIAASLFFSCGDPVNTPAPAPAPAPAPDASEVLPGTSWTFVKEFTAQDLYDMGAVGTTSNYYSDYLSELTITYKFYFKADGKAYFEGDFDNDFIEQAAQQDQSTCNTIDAILENTLSRRSFTWDVSESDTSKITGTITISGTDYDISGELEDGKLNVTYSEDLAAMSFLCATDDPEATEIECDQSYIAKYDGIMILFGVTAEEFTSMGQAFTVTTDYTLSGKVINFTDSGFDILLPMLGNATAIIVYNNELVMPLPSSLYSIEGDTITFTGDLTGLSFEIPTHCSLSHDNKIITLTTAGAQLMFLI
ncbi:MAG: hypothetical protein J5747_08650 [Spirochaetaceae bacterium]|nr:hypothetical protein [Spirochaetaceae bacterium]